MSESGKAAFDEAGNRKDIDESDYEANWTGCSRWLPSSSTLLTEAEKNVMAKVKTPYKKKFVNIGNGNKLWTYIFNKEALENSTPLVLVHGFAGGIGLWSLNFDSLCQDRTVYAFDLLGFGKSSRPKFSKKSLRVEDQFVESIEQWRQSLGIKKMVLLGHSFGGYLVSLYALKYPGSIEHLILADPWGYPEYIENDPDRRHIPWYFKVIAKLLSPFNPLAFVRALGPWGPGLVKKIRSDLGEKFIEDSDSIDEESQRNAAIDYIYHCNAQSPTGEEAFRRLTQKIAYAKRPMINRIHDLDINIPVSVLYGDSTWMDKRIGDTMKNVLSDSNVSIYTIKDAGHHVYADQPNEFREVIDTIYDQLLLEEKS